MHQPGDTSKTEGGSGHALSRPAFDDPRPTPFTERQATVHKWLGDVAPTLSPAYESVIRLLAYPTFPARAHLVCHVMRDLYGTLPAALNAQYIWRHEDEDYKNKLKDVDTHWPSAALELFQDNNTPPESDVVPIPIAGVKAVNVFLEKYRTRSTQTMGIRALPVALCSHFGEREGGPTRHLVEMCHKDGKWFTGKAHLTHKRGTTLSEDGISERVTRFDDLILSFVTPYFAQKQHLDEDLQQANQ